MQNIFILFIAFLLIGSTVSQFVSKPDVSFYSGTSSGTVVKISPDQSQIMVGFKNGMLKIYDINGYFQSAYSSHVSQVIDIQWPSGSGPITLDSSGVAIRWSSSGSVVNRWQMNRTAYGMSVTSDYFNQYIAINVGAFINEYYMSTGLLRRTYQLGGGVNFTQIQYSLSYNFLWVSTSDNYIRIFRCSTGLETGYTYYSGIGNSIRSMSLMSDGNTIVFLTSSTSSNYLYTLSSTATYYYKGYASSSKLAIACPSTNYFALAQTFFQDISIYDSNGIFQQYLTYMTGYVQGLDCSNNKLAAIDDYGYVTINSYTGFPVWAIGLICGGVALIIVVVVIIACVNRRKRRLQMMGGYGQMDNQAPISQNYFPNQPQGYNPNLYNPNQGYNSGQGHIPIAPVNPMGYPTQNQGYNPNPINPSPIISSPISSNPYNGSNGISNPYQTNQPRNWN